MCLTGPGVNGALLAAYSVLENLPPNLLLFIAESDRSTRFEVFPETIAAYECHVLPVARPGSGRPGRAVRRGGGGPALLLLATRRRLCGFVPGELAEGALAAWSWLERCLSGQLLANPKGGANQGLCASSWPGKGRCLASGSRRPGHSRASCLA